MSAAADTETRQLAARARASDAAWAELAVAQWHRVACLHALATGDEAAVGPLSEATFEAARRDLDSFLRDDEPFGRWLAAQTRDVAKSRLAPDDYARTAWGRAQDLLSDPPAVRGLGREALHGGEAVGTGAVAAALDDLAAGQRLFVRLLFVEGFPAGRLAGVLGVPVSFVRSFAYGLLERLGDLDELELAVPSGEGIQLGVRALEARGNQAELRALLEAHAGDPGAKTLLFRCVRLGDALSRDPLARRDPDPRWISELVRDALAGEAGPAPSAPPGRGSTTAEVPDRAPPREGPGAGAPAETADAPPPPRRPRAPPAKLTALAPQADPGRRRRERVAQAGFAAFILGFFVTGLYALFGGKSLVPRFRSGALVADLFATEAPPRRAVIGRVTTPRGDTRDLVTGQNLFASPLGPSAVRLEPGPAMTLAAGGGLRAFPQRVELLRGGLTARVRDPADAAVHFRVPRAVATTPKGQLALRHTPGGDSLVAVKGGGASVAIAGGPTVELDPFRLLRLRPDGTYRVEDAPAPLFLDPLFGLAGDPARVVASGLSPGSGGTALRRSLILAPAAPADRPRRRRSNGVMTAAPRRTDRRYRSYHDLF